MECRDKGMRKVLKEGAARLNDPSILSQRGNLASAHKRCMRTLERHTLYIRTVTVGNARLIGIDAGGAKQREDDQP
jgi:hypothetical protein